MNFQGFFFEREDVALPGFSKFFKKSSDEEREHAQLFMGYQNKRGGEDRAAGRGQAEQERVGFGAGGGGGRSGAGEDSQPGEKVPC